ncbi:MAG TPA: hypothetical protein VFD58_36615 [Blastocatellia bacterium]|nr:hypothetical protein [Blastocatellia bacterium]
MSPQKLLIGVFIIGFLTVSCSHQEGGTPSKDSGSSGSSNTLTREKALSLLAGKKLGTVKMSIRLNNSSKCNDPQSKVWYDKFIKDGVLTCKWSTFPLCPNGAWDRCETGNGAQGMDVTGSFIAGHREAKSIEGISKIDGQTAIANVVTTFKPTSEIYSKYKDFFDYDEPGTTQRLAKDGLIKAHFRLYDDGWRLAN